MKCSDILERLDELSPAAYAMDWDNVGLLVGRLSKEVHKVCIAVDATSEVIDQAISMQADLLLTHHPMLFRGQKSVRQDDYVGKRIIQLVKHDIAYIAMHTNFDVMGMADAAADELKLKERQVFEVTKCDDDVQEGLGRIGKLPRIMTLQECAAYVKEVFHLPQVMVYGELSQDVERMAVLPGAGKEEVSLAASRGADVYLTGDVTHHVGIDAVEQGICVIDAGHYGIERIFVPYLRDYFLREMPELEAIAVEERFPYTLI